MKTRLKKQSSFHPRLIQHGLVAIISIVKKLQYLIFPDGVSYNRKNDSLRTFRVNQIFLAMVYLASTSEKDKPESSIEDSGLSDRVVRAGLEPATHGFSVHCSTN